MLRFSDYAKELEDDTIVPAVVCGCRIESGSLVDLRDRSYRVLGGDLRRQLADGPSGADWVEADLLRCERFGSSDELQIAGTAQLLRPVETSILCGTLGGAVDH